VAEAVSEEAVFTWSGRAVDIGRLEAELVRLRYQAAGGDKPGGEAFAIRTSLHNLVVHAVDEEAARHAAQVIARLPSHHPSRAIIAVTNPSRAESRIDAELAAHCHLNPGWEQQVCCEEVTLRVSGRAAHHLHSVIIPLLVSDLPVYVWWQGELPRDRHVLEEIIGSADRLIVDSAQFAEVARGLTRLAQLRIDRPGCAIGDLNWGRLTPWRQLLLQHCQAPGGGRQPPALTNVEIHFAKGKGREQPGQALRSFQWKDSGQALRRGSGQALLLLGWLAGRFGWDTKEVSRDDSGGSLTVRSGVALKLIPERDGQGLGPGWLVSVELRDGSKRGRNLVSIRRTGDPLHLEVRVEDGRAVLAERVRIEACDEGEMLAQELDTLGHDAEYEEALGKALAIL
jgi:glucose-6-phosphate dehydrogenase assembly protein OpcA